MEKVILPHIPGPPSSRWQSRTRGSDKEWEDCLPEEWATSKGEKEFRCLPPATSEVRAWAHALVDYIADACEAGLKCEFDENHIVAVYQRDGEFDVGIVLPEKKK